MAMVKNFSLRLPAFAFNSSFLGIAESEGQHQEVNNGAVAAGILLPGAGEFGYRVQSDEEFEVLEEDASASSAGEFALPRNDPDDNLHSDSSLDTDPGEVGTADYNLREVSLALGRVKGRTGASDSTMSHFCQVKIVNQCYISHNTFPSYILLHSPNLLSLQFVQDWHKELSQLVENGKWGTFRHTIKRQYEKRLPKMRFRAVLANLSDPSEAPEIVPDVNGDLPKRVFMLPRGGKKFLTMIEGSVSLREVRRFHRRILKAQGITDREEYERQCKDAIVSSDGVVIEATKHW